MPKKREKWRKRRGKRSKLVFRGIIAMLIAAVIIPYLYLPKMNLPGTDITGPMRVIEPDNCRLLIDSTGFDPEKQERVIKQEIFDNILEMIADSKSFIVADFFLLNPWKGAFTNASYRTLSSELAEALIAKKRANPNHTIILLTDPINRIYGNDEPPFYRKMVENGIYVVFTDIRRLPHSNLVYSPCAGFYGKWIAKPPTIRKHLQKRTIANVLDSSGKDISPLQLLRMLNFKANHRKVIITDDSDGNPCVLISSFNPADGSSAHSNIAIMTGGAVAIDALESELNCVEWSAENTATLPGTSADGLKKALTNCRRFADNAVIQEPPADGPRAQWLTEESIRRKILSMLSNTGPGSQVNIAMFYCSDPLIVRSIADAAYSGAEVRVVFDANRDAFGREKIGIPNRPAAARMLKKAGKSGRLQIRWAATHGEQFHTKSISIVNKYTGQTQFLCGSANWTRRNLKNLNMEACIYIENVPSIVQLYTDFFDRIWQNDGGLVYTLDYESAKEDGFALFWKNIVYFLQESTGASTF